MVLIPFLPPIRTSLPNLTEALEQGKLGIVKYILHWILFIMAFPYLVAYTWTIPNCSTNRKWYVVTSSFLMAILWIAVISFGMVTLVARVGCILGVGEFTMGLVVVAVGTSIPVSPPSVFIHLQYTLRCLCAFLQLVLCALSPTLPPPPPLSPGCYQLHTGGQGWVWGYGCVKCHWFQCL